ncbi:hypothetical protein PYW07_009132 [Mythimna separata]|uniref:FP protein C-terminal domain-containing protein n=1 Tax=Mythimna separata TaxID=271217 RepID=A0AAD7YBB8_MYTSE|nr:hypothetical protein PYW07_009132 [Mythimna separata]
MPLKRTPPSTPTEDRNVKSTVSSHPRAFVQSGSSPDLTTVGHDSNVSSRLKRKRDDCDCLPRLDEIRSLLSTSTTKADSKFSDLQKAITEIMAQNAEIKESISFMSKEYDDIKIKISSLETERENERRYIRQLEEKVDNMERQLFSTKIEIRNVPQKQDESREDLYALVEKTANVIGHTLKSNEIREVYRVKNKNNSTTINVDFISTVTKELIIKKARKFNNTNKNNKLNTTHLKIEGPLKPIFLSEKLTPKAQRLYYLARCFAENNKFKYCWTSFGKILIKRADGDRYVMIKTEADLDNLAKNE